MLQGWGSILNLAEDGAASQVLPPWMCLAEKALALTNVGPRNNDVQRRLIKFSDVINGDDGSAPLRCPASPHTCLA